MEVLVKLKWWVFCQNNSGGSFDVDENVSHYVYVQAVNVEQAIAKAEQFCDNSNSCPCCGDRWSFYYTEESDGSDTPMVWGKPPTLEDTWMKDHNRFHYYDGRVTEVFE